MQEVQIKLEAVTALKLKLTDAEKNCKGLEAQLQPLKDAQAVSFSSRHQKGIQLVSVSPFVLLSLSDSVFLLSDCFAW